MLDIKSVVSNLNRNALGGTKIPHAVSNSVLRQENEKIYIAAFVYTYNRENLQSNKMPRPTQWLLADIESGEIIKEYDCRSKDFSDAEFDTLYDLNDPNVKRPSREDFVEIYTLFDDIRNEITKNDLQMVDKYHDYLNRILEITPSNYQRFYKDLSNL
ncbi:MAG: hypothetical protein J1F23_06020 [Oscillospiraceae bacterium]|nr:hypothetical protein [Oscillospiraceae bacterium]